MSVQTSPLDARFVALLLDTMLKTVPGENGQDDTARRDFARILFAAFKPSDAIEAALAARAVAAHFAAMDSYARAASPGTSDEKVLRLRGNAFAASRSFDAVLRTLDKRRKPAGQAAFQDTVAKTAQAAKPTPAAPRLDVPIEIPGFPQPAKPTSRRAEYHATTSLNTRLLELAAA